jgi:hypothetical protein
MRLSRNGTSAIYESTYYLGIVMQSLPPSRSFTEFQHTFLIRKRFVRNMFGTPVQPPQSLAWDRGLRVARNTFLWVLLTHKNFTWGSGPLLCMACTSPIGFNWSLCTITEKFGVSTLVFLCCFQLPKQENLRKPFEWHSKINTAHTHTSLYCPLIIKLLYTPLRLVFPSAIQQIVRRGLVKISIIFIVTSSGHTVMVQYHQFQ